MSDYDLVMPFITVRSVGGPHDDESYVAGWTMGHLDAVLEHQKPAMHEDTIYADSIPQADIIAMRHGYRSHFVEGPDGWSFMTLIRADDAEAALLRDGLHDRAQELEPRSGFWARRLWHALTRRFG